MRAAPGDQQPELRPDAGPSARLAARQLLRRTGLLASAPPKDQPKDREPPDGGVGVVGVHAGSGGKVLT